VQQAVTSLLHTCIRHSFDDTVSVQPASEAADTLVRFSHTYNLDAQMGASELKARTLRQAIAAARDTLRTCSPQDATRLDAVLGSAGSAAVPAPATATGASSRRAPSKADGTFLEHVVTDSITQCLNIALGQQAKTAHATLASQVAGLIVLFHRTNPDATIPYGEGRHVTLRQDVASVIKQLNEKPAEPAGAEPCAADLAERLANATAGE
jgi:hypothetical protein